MGFLSRLTKRASAPTQMSVEGVLVEGDGNSVEVVGESHYLDALIAITGRRGTEHVRYPVMAALVREPENAYDDQAVAIWIEGQRVGHLSRSDARAYQPVLLELVEQGKVLACNAMVCGREGKPNLGVWLDLPEPHDVLDTVAP